MLAKILDYETHAISFNATATTLNSALLDPQVVLQGRPL